MLASAADDIRVWEGDKFDNIVQHYRPNVQKVSSLVWNSSSEFSYLFSLESESVSE